MKIALAMICKGTKEEAKHLDTALYHAAGHVDGIFVTLNAPKGEEIDPACYKVCKKHKATVSEFVWGDDFAEARNFNFAQVPKSYDYILWIDADDALRGGAALRKIIEATNKDCYSMWYQYDFDEQKRPYIVHQKVRVVRNDGTFVWRGRLHENIGSTRDVSIELIKGVDVLHLSTREHFEENKKRNLRIALKGKEEFPDDPRSYWNTGNAYHGSGMYEEALIEFATFLQTTESDEEKYIACLRVGEELWNTGKQYEAINQLRYAIGIRPTYPDAYTKMGAMLVSQKRYKDAVMYLTQSLKFPPPEDSIVVFNPRDYDYEPIRLLAVAHFEMNEIEKSLAFFKMCLEIYPQDEDLKSMVKKIGDTVETTKAMEGKAELMSQMTDEDLRKELDALDPKDRAHPAICHLANTRFFKTESSGKEIAIFCGFTQHEWSPEIAATKGVGGSEEAVIHLARRWAKLGWTVTVYNSCGFKEQADEEYTQGIVNAAQNGIGSVIYKPWWMWNYRDRQDITILWRHPFMAQYEINSGKVLVDMHDVLSADEFTPERLAHIDYVCFKTTAHADLFPKIPGEKKRIIANGIQPDQFTGASKKEKGLIINTSSPDRSLSACLDIFEEVKKRNPEARFEWAYGWEVFDNAHGDNKRMMEWKATLQARMKTLGVVEHGRLNTQQIAELYERGHVFLYPTGFYEIFCISAVKAQLAGAYPVCTDFAALKEVVIWGDTVHVDIDKNAWAKPYQFDYAIGKEAYPAIIEKTVAALEGNPHYTCPVRDEIISRYDWDRVAGIWQNLFNHAKA